MCAGRGNNDRVHTLNLACNAIDAEGVDALEELLMDNRTIRILDLTDNDLGPKGACALSLQSPQLGLTLSVTISLAHAAPLLCVTFVPLSEPCRFCAL